MFNGKTMKTIFVRSTGYDHEDLLGLTFKESRRAKRTFAELATGQNHENFLLLSLHLRLGPIRCTAEIISGLCGSPGICGEVQFVVLPKLYRAYVECLVYLFYCLNCWQLQIFWLGRTSEPIYSLTWADHSSSLVALIFLQGRAVKKKNFFFLLYHGAAAWRRGFDFSFFFCCTTVCCLTTWVWFFFFLLLYHGVLLDDVGLIFLLNNLLVAGEDHQDDFLMINELSTSLVKFWISYVWRYQNFISCESVVPQSATWRRDFDFFFLLL